MSRLVAFLAAATLVVACSAASAASTRVWLVSESPLRVAGSGFVPGEHVAVTVAAGKKLTARRTVVASATGRLAARWRVSTAAGCHSTTIVARGSAGSFARWREVVNDCEPPGL
jgi:hypothetical protein